MAIREILVYPDSRLRQIAEPVTVFDSQLKTLVDDMAETMYAAPGIGLAAIQINVTKRIVVLDLSEQKNDLKVFINPKTTSLDKNLIQIEEGCLSVPGFAAPVDRIEHVLIEAQDVNGKPFEVKADGLLSICIQHEIDHLDGKVFVDYLSRLKRHRIRKKLEKEKRQNQLAVA